MSEPLRQAQLPSGVLLSLRKGDLTTEDVDAIVNAANCHLQHGGGLAGAIPRAGGPEIQRESNRIGYVPTGTAAITGAGNLPARWVIHAVGPIWGSVEEAEADRLLASAAEAALEMASAKGLASVALPAISAGIYGFPKDRCAAVMLGAVMEYLNQNADTPLRDIRFVLMGDDVVQAFEEAWKVRLDALSN
jgi:O-acetyl-ADP-ribose deacetylase (regulator of RNase III)